MHTVLTELIRCLSNSYFFIHIYIVLNLCKTSGVFKCLHYRLSVAVGKETVLDLNFHFFYSQISCFRYRISYRYVKKQTFCEKRGKWLSVLEFQGASPPSERTRNSTDRRLCSAKAEGSGPNFFGELVHVLGYRKPVVPLLLLVSLWLLTVPLTARAYACTRTCTGMHPRGCCRLPGRPPFTAGATPPRWQGRAQGRCTDTRGIHTSERALSPLVT